MRRPCDAATLGPLRDLTPFAGPRLAGALRWGDREEVFESLRDELETAPGTVLVVEDVHWSDEATLDALRFLARRIDALPAVLVLTYRDDELDGAHPLTRMLGDVHSNVRYIAVQRLSPSAVGALAVEGGFDPDRIFALTRGNPYSARTPHLTRVASVTDPLPLVP
jgi:hypothetical protein